LEQSVSQSVYLVRVGRCGPVKSAQHGVQQSSTLRALTRAIMSRDSAGGDIAGDDHLAPEIPEFVEDMQPKTKGAKKVDELASAYGMRARLTTKVKGETLAMIRDGKTPPYDRFDSDRREHPELYFFAPREPRGRTMEGKKWSERELVCLLACCASQARWVSRTPRIACSDHIAWGIRMHLHRPITTAFPSLSAPIDFNTLSEKSNMADLQTFARTEGLDMSASPKKSKTAFFKELKSKYEARPQLDDSGLERSMRLEDSALERSVEEEDIDDAAEDAAAGAAAESAEDDITVRISNALKLASLPKLMTPGSMLDAVNLSSRYLACTPVVEGPLMSVRVNVRRIKRMGVIFLSYHARQAELYVSVAHLLFARHLARSFHTPDCQDHLRPPWLPIRHRLRFISQAMRCSGATVTPRRNWKWCTYKAHGWPSTKFSRR
jgi:hypothetical protein